MQSQNDKFKRWVKTRPPAVRVVARTIKPDRYYIIVETGQVVRLYSYSGNGTVSVLVMNGPLFMGHIKVFGVNPSSLRRATLDELVKRPPLRAITKISHGRAGNIEWSDSSVQLVPAWHPPKSYTRALAQAAQEGV